MNLTRRRVPAIPGLACPALAALPVLVLCGCVVDPFGTNRVPRPDPLDDSVPCEEGGESSLLALQGSLADAEHWSCFFGDGAGAPAFDTYAGLTVGVNGGSLALQLFPDDVPDLDERDVYVGIDGLRGVFVTRLQLRDDGRAHFDLHFRTDAPAGDYTMLVAIDDGGTPDAPVLGDVLAIPLTVIGVAPGGADIQVTVNWRNRDGSSAYTDVDLHVVDPNGDRVAYFNPAVPSGGQLDLDSNAACAAGDYNENIYWPVGRAVPGAYLVQLNYWSACGYGGVVDYRVTVLRDGQLLRIVDGELTPAEASPDGLYLDIIEVPYD